MVIGASLEPKLLIVCAVPSSMIRKFSFFRPVSRSPRFVAAITSIVTTGTSTEMLAPASCGFCCGGTGLGSTGGAPGCFWPPCGPSGACPRAFIAPTPKASALARNAGQILEKFTLMLGPSIYNDRRTCAGAPTPSGTAALLISKSGTRMLLQVAIMLFPAVAPLAAQGIPPNPATAQTNSSPLADTAALSREALVWLAQLIQINTTNPPGNEQAAAKYIAGILEKEGITPEILEVAPGRSAVVARLRSSAISDPSRALLLVAHMDVVGAERARWTVDPFGAVMKDGYIYGRGSIDDKSMLAANLAAIIALKRSNAH